MNVTARYVYWYHVNLPALVLKARQLSGSAFCWDWVCLSMDGYPLGLGLVVEDKRTEFSCTEFEVAPTLL